MGEKYQCTGSRLPNFEMNFIQADRNAEIHETKPSDVRWAGDAIDTRIHNTSPMGMAVHRWLCFASFHGGLDGFFQSGKVTTSKVAEWSDRKDYGYTTWHKLSRKNPLAPAHWSRISAALSICAGSVRLQWLCGLVREVCFKGRRNLIVFCAWPATQWVVELLLFVIGVPAMTIRAVHSAATRAETHEAFNHVDTRGTVLVTNLRLGATSMNLQKGCSDLVFLEVPESANTAAQGIGRVHRIGQTRAQNIYIVTVDHTWDQRQQARAALKMYGQIAGQAEIPVDDGEVLALATTISGEGEGAESEPLTAEARVRMAGDRMRHEAVVKLYMEMFCQRSRRNLWTAEGDLTEKDFLETEAESPMERNVSSYTI